MRNRVPSQIKQYTRACNAKPHTSNSDRGSCLHGTGFLKITEIHSLKKTNKQNKQANDNDTNNKHNNNRQTNKQTDKQNKTKQNQTKQNKQRERANLIAVRLMRSW